MTEQELLEDTVKYYHKNPLNRCISPGGGCWYSPESILGGHKGTGCAIGRKMTKKNRLLLDRLTKNTAVNMPNSGISAVLCNEEAIKLLPKWMRGMSRSFLVSLQEFHDENDSFNREGITITGKEIMKDLFCEYDLSFLKEL